MKNKNKYLLFALPSFILIFAIMLFPVGYAVVYSFTDYRLGKEAGFTGLENYISVLQDSEFISALIFTIILTVTAVLCQFVFGMIIALLLDNIHHFKKPISIMIYIPYFITAAAMGVIFQVDVHVKLGNCRPAVWSCRNKYSSLARFSGMGKDRGYYRRSISEYTVCCDHSICGTAVYAV